MGTHPCSAFKEFNSLESLLLAWWVGGGGRKQEEDDQYTNGKKKKKKKNKSSTLVHFTLESPLAITLKGGDYCVNQPGTARGATPSSFQVNKLSRPERESKIDYIEIDQSDSVVRWSCCTAKRRRKRKGEVRFFFFFLLHIVCVCVCHQLLT